MWPVEKEMFLQVSRGRGLPTRYLAWKYERGYAWILDVSGKNADITVDGDESGSTLDFQIFQRCLGAAFRFVY